MARLHENSECILRVAEKTGIPKEIVYKTYRAYWKAIREHISSLPLKNSLTEEEFMKLQPNVNIPSMGKLHVTLDRYKRMQKQQEIINKIKENKDVAHK